LRNPFRNSFDRATGELWIGDVGQGAVEEIDRVQITQSGLNMGWPLYEGSQPLAGGGTAGLTMPVAEYFHGTGVRGWAMYALTDEREVDGCNTSFLLAPRLPGALESPPVESVLFARDEMANLAWAIEQRVADAAGEGRDRFDEWVARAREGSDQAPAVGTPPRYVVATEVPDHWLPLAPVQLADHESVSLVLESLVRAMPDGPPLRLLPLGALLAQAATDQPLWLFEEEVPRSGASVTRADQRARWHGGSVHAWTARRKGSGTGESSSGLRYDGVEEPG